jgi:hypothetical protein
MEPWRVCLPVVANSQHFDEEQNPDLNYCTVKIPLRSRVSEKMDSDPDTR